MRLVRSETGNRYAINYKQSYTEVYSQPVLRYFIAWLYHKYDMNKLVWKFWRFFERYQDSSDEWSYIPYTARQDMRCDDLRHKGRITIERTYGPKEMDNKNDGVEH